MYDEANIITLAEINRTVLENKHPKGSRIIGRVKEIEFILKIFQLIKIVKFLEKRKIDEIRGKGNKNQRSLLALIENDGMVMGINNTFLKPQFSDLKLIYHNLIKEK